MEQTNGEFEGIWLWLGNQPSPLILVLGLTLTIISIPMMLIELGYWIRYRVIRRRP